MSLTERWLADWTALGTPPVAVDIRDALLARYAEPHRAYHTRQHLEECFAHLESARDLAARFGEVAIALWFHDAIYDPCASDNEARSAEWAAQVLESVGAAPAQVDRVRGLILATRHAGLPDPGDPALLVDIDLAILGAGTTRFEEYQRQIREEYARIPEPLYSAGRASILAGFLARPRIYSTARFGERYEAQARANLERAVARLRA